MSRAEIRREQREKKKDNKTYTLTARELEQLEQRIRKEEQQKAKQMILEQTNVLAEQILIMMLVIPTNVLVADYWKKSAKKRIPKFVDDCMSLYKAFTSGTVMKQRYDKTIIEQAEQFGLENRLLQCTEEAGELIQALSKYQRIQQGDKTCQTDMIHAEYMIAEEIADVEICIEQLKYLLGNTEQIEQIKEEKIQRTEHRLLYGCEEEQRIKVTSAEIIVANTKGARQNKPYYEIKYKVVGHEEYNIGFGSYKLPYVLYWLDTCLEIVEEQNTNNTDSISEVYEDN